MGIFKKIRIGEFLRNLFGRQYKLFKENSELAVKITEKLKQIVNSPVADILTAIIPGDIDKKILDKVREVANRLALEMAIAHGLIQASETNADAWAAIIADLKTKLPEGRAGFWMEFSARLNEALADGKLELSEAAALAQLIYIEKRKA